MNDVLSQILQVAPGIGAGLSGNGPGMQAFMEAYQRTNAMLDQREMQRQTFSQQTADRQRSLERQQASDARLAEQDRIAAEDRARRLESEKLGLLPKLAELGGTADTDAEAQRMIETVIPGLMKAFGQDTMAYGMPAVDMATRTITGRQKRQVSEYIDAAMKTSYVADHPDSDPEIANLPDHIKRILGKPTAKLSELQSFAELPVGKPPKRPGDDVSWQPDDAMVGGKLTRVLFNPKTREYKDQQGNPVVVDPIPPRPPASSQNDDETKELAQQLVDGFLVPSMLSRRGNYNAVLAEANRLSQAKSGRPYNAARAQTEYAAAQRFVAALNGPQQQRFRALAGTVVNTIDEVRELSREMKNSGVPLLNRGKLIAYSQAMGNTPQGQLTARYLAAVNTLKEEFASLAQGGYAPTEAAWHLADQQINGDFGQQQMDAALTEVQRLINYRMQAFDTLTPYGVSPTNPVMPGGAGSTPAPVPSHAPSGPRKGERRRFGDVLGEWDGTKWIEVKP